MYDSGRGGIWLEPAGNAHALIRRATHAGQH